MDRLIADQPFHALSFEGRRFDCGTKLGFLEANLALALAHPDLGAEFAALVQRYAARGG